MPEWFIQLAIGTAVTGIISLVIHSLRQQNDGQQKELDDLKDKFNEKCEFQQKQTSLLFTKHDEDAMALQNLKYQIASEHYVKQELDARFDKLEAAFTQGFSELGAKFDRLSDRLLEHSTNLNGTKK